MGLGAWLCNLDNLYPHSVGKASRAHGPILSPPDLELRGRLERGPGFLFLLDAQLAVV